MWQVHHPREPALYGSLSSRTLACPGWGRRRKKTPTGASCSRTGGLSERQAGRLLCLIGIGLYVLNLWAYRRLAVDDAFISFRYSRNLAAGAGFSWNPDGVPVAGFSNFLWVILLTPAAWVGVPLPAAARFLGVVSGWGVWVLLYRALRRWLPDRVETPLILGTFTYLFLGNRSLALHSLSGMETVLHLLLVSWATVLILDRRADGGLRGSLQPLLAMLLLFLSRPEGVGVAGVLCAAWILRSRARARWILPVSLAAMYGAYLWWHWSYFGLPFPNSLYVKSGLLAHFRGRLHYVARFLGENLFLLALALPVLWAARYRVILGVIAFHLVLALVFQPWMGFHHRFMYPGFSLLAVAAALGCLRVRAWLGGRAWAYSIVVLLFAPLSLASLRCFLPPWWQAGGLIGPGGLLVHREIEIGKAMGTWELSRRPVLAFGDAGAIPYYSGFQVIDDVGLNDPLIARAKSPEEAVRSIISRKPDLAIMPMVRPTNRLEDTFPEGHGILGRHQLEYHQALLNAGFRSVRVVPTPSYALNLLVRQDSDLATELEEWIRRSWPESSKPDPGAS